MRNVIAGIHHTALSPKRVLQLILLAPLGLLGADEVASNCTELNPSPIGCTLVPCQSCPTIACQGEPFEPCELPAGYAQYAGIALDRCIDIFVSGDFLYWKPVRRNSVSIFEFLDDPSNTILMVQEKVNYRPAFKVGLGMTFPCFDNWTLQADYTRYHHDFTHTYTAPEGGHISPFSVPFLLFPFTSIRATLKYNYDDIKLTLHRAFYVGPRLILDPYFGLRGTKRGIKDSQVLTLIPPIIFPEGLDQNFQTAKFQSWYASMIAGGYGSFLLCGGLRLIFKGEIGAGYCRLIKNTSRVINNSTIPLGVIEISQSYPKNPHVIQAMGTGGGGLGWGSYFCCQKYHFDLSAIYELDSIWGPFLDYNTILLLTDTQFRGLTVHAQIDF